MNNIFGFIKKIFMISILVNLYTNTNAFMMQKNII